MAVYRDGWIMDGWTVGRATDGWIVCPSVKSDRRIEYRIGGQTGKILYPRSYTRTCTR